MTKKQSRQTQRILEKQLFGPGPKPLRRTKQRTSRSVPPAPPGSSPGNCWACGNCCFLARDDDRWTCPACHVTYTKARPEGMTPNERMTPKQLQDELVEVLTPPAPDDDLSLAYDFFGTSGVFFAERDEYPESVEDLTPEQLRDYAKWLRKTGITQELQDDPYSVPPRYYFQDVKRLPEGSWLIHHTDARLHTFDRGAELHGLHLSTWNRRKPMAGKLNLDDEISAYERVYAFAFTVEEDPTIDRQGRPKPGKKKYGRNLYIFQCDSAVEAFHEGDNEEQAIFPVGSEYNFHHIWVDEFSDRWGVSIARKVGTKKVLDEVFFNTIDELTAALEEADA